MNDKIPIVDLNQEILLHIDGEVTKQHTIPWDVLRNVGDKLQELVRTLAKYSLEDDDYTILDNYNLEFTGFYDGSATPAWALQTPAPNLFNSDEKLRKNLSTDFSRVMYHVDKGNFQAIADTYKGDEVKNEVITKVFNFTNAAGTAPVEIVKRRKKGDGFAKVFTIRKISKEVYEKLYVNEIKAEAFKPIEDVTGVGKVIVKQGKGGKVSRKLSEIYTEKDAVLSLKIENIITLDRRYELSTPIYFQFYQEGKGKVIENEQLDLFAAGKNLDKAKAELFNQFDHTYQRLNELTDDQLSNRLKAVKSYYNLIVKKVIAN